LIEILIQSRDFKGIGQLFCHSFFASYGRITGSGEQKRMPANWENTRWTGVLEKRDGRWVIIQQHFSFAS
jgi:hypothetical protein